MNRRHVLRSIGAGSVIALAGCGDGGGSGDDSGGDDGSNDGGSTGSDGGSGGDGGSTTTAPETTTEDPTGPGGTTTETETGLPTFDDHHVRDPNHRLRMEIDDYAGNGTTATYEGVYVDGDYRISVTAQGQSMTLYNVDGTSYGTIDGQCRQGGNSPDLTAGSEEWTDPEDPERVSDLAEKRPVRTDSYEGEQMYVYELGTDETNVDRTVEYWVSGETGYVRRLVMDGLVAEYWDWGQVSESISPPC